jgi:DNA repair exonuclease SbcCD ATPase subunit
MCKKIGIAALAVVAGLFILNNTRLGSYGWTAWNKAKKTAKAQVPLEFELERVRQQVAQLVPDMKQNLTKIAEEIVAVENMREEITVTKTNLNKQKDAVRAMTDELKSGNERIVFNHRPYSRTRIAEKLASDLKSCQRCEEELKVKEQMLENREKALDSEREKLTSMRQQKQELEVAISKLEADLKAVRLAQTKSKFAIDDSRLSQIKLALAEIQNRLRIEAVANDLHGEFANDPAVKVEGKAKPAADVVKEAEAYLGGDSKKDANKIAVGTNDN